MAVIGSSGGGYATVDPTNDYIGQALQGVQYNLFRAKAFEQDKQRDRANQLRQQSEDRRKDQDDSEELRKQNPYAYSGTDLDATLRGNYDVAMREADAAMIAYRNGDNNAKIRYDNIIKGVKSMTEMSSSLNTITDALEKGKDDLDETSYTEVKDRIANLKKGHLSQSYDENGNPQWSYFTKDENDKVSSVPNKKMNKIQLQEFLTADVKLDMNKAIETYKKTAGDSKSEKLFNPKTNMDITTTSYPGADVNSTRMANDIMAKNPRSARRMYGISPDDKSQDAEVAIKMKNQFMAATPTFTSETFNGGAANLKVSQANLAQRIKQAKIGNARNVSKDEAETNSVTITDSTDPLTGQPIRTETRKVITKQPKVTTNIPKVQSSNNKKLRKESDYASVYISNKGKLGLIDETWHNIATGEKLRDNQVVSEYAIAEKASKTDLTPKQYREFLIKKGIYITK